MESSALAGIFVDMDTSATPQQIRVSCSILEVTTPVCFQHEQAQITRQELGPE